MIVGHIDHHDGLTSAANISPCGHFRYWLARYWEPVETARPLLFIMLNPSTADARQDDHTIRKCIGFAKRLGFGGIDVVNLFAYRATSPADLKRAGWPEGDGNLESVLNVADLNRKSGGQIIVAWGGNARGRPDAPRRMLAALRAQGHTLYALRQAADLTPWHPLMLPYTCQPEELRA